jgi:hypothetical protein
VAFSSFAFLDLFVAGITVVNDCLFLDLFNASLVTTNLGNFFRTGKGFRDHL